MMISDKVETAAMTIWVDEGMVRIRSKGVMSTPESVHETYEAIRRLVEDGPMPVLFDARAWPGPRLEAWGPLVENMPSVFTAGAIVISPELATELGEFPSMVNRLMMPFRTFTEESDAVAFLRAHQQTA